MMMDCKEYLQCLRLYGDDALLDEDSDNTLIWGFQNR